MDFLGEIWRNFKLKNMISTYPKDLSWKKWLIFTRFQRKKIPNHLNFMMSFNMLAKDIEGF
jgi:hypothetical protein